MLETIVCVYVNLTLSSGHCPQILFVAFFWTESGRSVEEAPYPGLGEFLTICWRTERQREFFLAEDE